MNQFPDTDRQRILNFINRYVVDEDFSIKHLAAIAKIVSFFNEDEQTESNIFGFADRLKKTGNGVDIHVGDKVFTLKVKDGYLKINTKDGMVFVNHNNSNSICLSIRKVF